MSKENVSTELEQIKEEFWKEYNSKHSRIIRSIVCEESHIKVKVTKDTYLFPKLYKGVNVVTTIQENTTTAFLLPGIEIKEELKDQFYSNGFKNTFLSCPPLTYPFPVIYLLFRPECIDLEFIRFGEELHKNPNFLETIDAGKGKVIFVYRVPNRFRHDYELFLQGKYSKLSAEYKQCFLMEQYKLDSYGKHVVEGGKWVREYTSFYHIFYRTDHIKEVWNERLGYTADDHIIDSLEFYDVQNPEKETMDEELWLG